MRWKSDEQNLIGRNESDENSCSLTIKTVDLRQLLTIYVCDQCMYACRLSLQLHGRYNIFTRLAT